MILVESELLMVPGTKRFPKKTAHREWLESEMKMPDEFVHRHPDTLEVFQWFSFDHLQGPLRQISEQCYVIAENMIIQLPDGPQLTQGLYKLLAAKDCFVRAALSIRESPQRNPFHGQLS